MLLSSFGALPHNNAKVTEVLCGERNTRRRHKQGVTTSLVRTNDGSALHLKQLVERWCGSLSLFRLSSGFYKPIFPIILSVSASPDLYKDQG